MEEDKQSSNRGASPELAIFSFLKEEIQFQQLLQVLERKTVTTPPAIKVFAGQFNDRKGFHSAFLDWVQQQCQPYLSLQLYEPSTDTTPTSSSSPIPNHVTTAVIAGRQTNAWDNNLETKHIIEQVPKSAAKPKKRVTPNAVSPMPVVGAGLTAVMTGSLGLQGNIASAPNSSPDALGNALHDRDKVLKSMATGAVAVATADQMRRMNLISDNSTSMTPMQHEMKRQSSILTAKSLKRPSLPYNVVISETQTPLLSSPDETMEAREHHRHEEGVIGSWRNMVDRVSSVFVALVMNQHVLLNDAIQLLTKLCNVPLPPSGRYIAVQILDHDLFPTVLQDIELFHYFVGRVAFGLLPIIRLFGDTLLTGFTGTLQQYHH